MSCSRVNNDRGRTCCANAAMAAGSRKLPSMCAATGEAGHPGVGSSTRIGTPSCAWVYSKSGVQQWWPLLSLALCQVQYEVRSASQSASPMRIVHGVSAGEAAARLYQNRRSPLPLRASCPAARRPGRPRSAGPPLRRCSCRMLRCRRRHCAMLPTAAAASAGAPCVRSRHHARGN